MSIAAEKLPLPRRDVRKKATAPRWFIKKSYRAAAATAYKKILPLPRRFSKTFFKFHCHGSIGPEILVLDD
jgi:hypothetical protein